MKSPLTPEPIIIRERPPHKPAPIEKKIITIPGKVIHSKRAVIIEKFESNAYKPPMIIIERWLPYDAQKRKVVYQKNSEQNKSSSDAWHTLIPSNNTNRTNMLIKAKNPYLFSGPKPALNTFLCYLFITCNKIIMFY